MALGTWREDPVKNKQLQNLNSDDPNVVAAEKERQLNEVVEGQPNTVIVTDKKGNQVYQRQDKDYKGPKNIEIDSLVGTNKQVSDQVQKALSDAGATVPGVTSSLTSSFNHNRTRSYRNRGGLLRYPFEALTEKTDYLQIDIVEYESANKSSGNQGNLIGRPGNRRIPLRSRIPGGLSTQSLVNKGTVLLQIPSQVQDGNSVRYGDSEMNTIVGAALQGAEGVMTGVADALGKEPNKAEGESRLGNASSALKAALGDALVASGLGNDGGAAARALITKKLATEVVGAFGAQVSVNQLLARSEGQILNPNMELLFDGPTLRNFRFSFKMTPRSEKEAEQCKLIIRTFKMNMAPKVTGSGANLFLNTPNVFELRYKSGFKNHPFLHKFKQCFLTDISVNYTAEGVYATYENKEPISMTMDLTFKELEPIYDNDYFDERGYDSDSTVGY